jgi:hypothetical protein
METDSSEETALNSHSTPDTTSTPDIDQKKTTTLKTTVMSVVFFVLCAVAAIAVAYFLHMRDGSSGDSKEKKSDESGFSLSRLPITFGKCLDFTVHDVVNGFVVNSCDVGTDVTRALLTGNTTIEGSVDQSSYCSRTDSSGYEYSVGNYMQVATTSRSLLPQVLGKSIERICIESYQSTGGNVSFNVTQLEAEYSRQSGRTEIFALGETNTVKDIFAVSSQCYNYMPANCSIRILPNEYGLTENTYVPKTSESLSHVQRVGSRVYMEWGFGDAGVYSSSYLYWDPATNGVTGTRVSGEGGRMATFGRVESAKSYQFEVAYPSSMSLLEDSGLLTYRVEGGQRSLIGTQKVFRDSASPDISLSLSLYPEYPSDEYSRILLNVYAEGKSETYYFDTTTETLIPVTY